MKDIAEQEVIDIGDWTSRRSTSSPPSRAGATACRSTCRPRTRWRSSSTTVRGDNRPYPPVPPRQIVPTLQSLAANAVMAGCKPEYFPVVTAAMRGVLDPEYNLHGTLATTHSCAPMVMVSGPIRHELGINCGSNCFGQGWRPNATIGRALGLMLLNIAGAKPGEMDRSTQGNPAKYTFCFGENEEENPWTPYHVQRGFAPSDSVVTVMSGEGPHNLNDHGSTTGDRPADDLRRRHVDARRQHGLRQGPDVRHHRPRACRDPEARRLHASTASARSCSSARASMPRGSRRRTRTPTPAPATSRTATGSRSAARRRTSTSPWPADRASTRPSSRRSAARPSPRVRIAG